MRRHLHCICVSLMHTRCTTENKIVPLFIFVSDWFLLVPAFRLSSHQTCAHVSPLSTLLWHQLACKLSVSTRYVSGPDPFIISCMFRLNYLDIDNYCSEFCVTCCVWNQLRLVWRQNFLSVSAPCHCCELLASFCGCFCSAHFRCWRLRGLMWMPSALTCSNCKVSVLSL